MCIKNSDIFEKMVGRLFCGNEEGTAFLISSEYAITATHCIEEYDESTPIKIEFRNIKTTSICSYVEPTIQLSEIDKPIALLKLQESISIDQYIPFTLKRLRPGMEIDIFGYLKAERNDGLWMHGRLNRVLTDEQVSTTDWNTTIEPVNTRIKDFKGYSGSPLIHNGSLVGVVGAQTNDSGQAIVVNAIEVSMIKDFLDFNHFDYNVNSEVDVSENLGVQNDVFRAISKELSTLSAVNDKLNNERDVLLNKKYEEIVEAQINGDETKGLHELLFIIDSEEKLKDKTYAQFYYLAAQWTLNTDKRKSKNYFEIALNLNPQLDTRCYKSGCFIDEKDFEAAEKILLPIDTTAVLNQYLILLYKQNKGKQACEFIKNCAVAQNATTHHILTLCYLQVSEFGDAKEYAKKLMHQSSTSAIFWYVDGLVKYWEAMPKDSKLVPCDSLPVFLNNYPVLTNEQKSMMQSALESFIKSTEFAKLYSNMHLEIAMTTACLLTSWILRRDDTVNYSKTLFLINPGNPVSILFSLDNDFDISSENIDLLKKNSFASDENAIHALVYITMLHKQKKYLEANAELALLEDKIKEFSYFEWIELQIATNIGLNDYAKAKSFIDNSNILSIDERKRFELRISLSNDSTNRTKCVKIAGELMKNPGKSIDYYNLCYIYRRYKMWKKIPSIAGKWFDKYNDLLAKEFLAEAYFYERPQKFIKTIRYIESVSELSIQLKRYKVSYLTSQSMFNEALVIIKEIGLSENDESLVIQQARIKIAQGDSLGAINILNTYVELNPKGIQSTLLLVDLLFQHDKHKSFVYIKQLYNLFPEDNAIGMRAALIGFNTGHDDEAHDFLMQVSEHDSERKFLKESPVSELIIMLEERRKSFEETNSLFFDGKIPYHLLFDSRNEGLGYYIYSNWIENDNYYLWWHFGARPECDVTDSFIRREIIIDYSACLTAFCLDLFPALEKYFAKIYISPNLLPCIMSEIDQLLKIQSSVRTSNEDLLNYFESENNAIAIVSIPTFPEICPNADVQDLELYYGALTNSAFVVKDIYTGEGLFGKKIPQELRDIQVYESEVLELLHRNNLIDFKAHQNYQNKPREDVIQKISNPGTKLLVDMVFLQTLIKNGNLQDVTSFLTMIVFERDISELKRYRESVRRQEKCVEWLAKLKDKLLGYVQRGLLEFCPTCESYNNASYKLTSALMDILHASDKQKIPIWVDDRCINSYANTVGIFDILHFLLKENQISFQEYCSKISSLNRHNVVYHVPSAEYVFASLRTARVQEAGVLKENSALKNIRKSIDNALCAESKIGTLKLPHVNFLELHGYLGSLQTASVSALRMIWGDLEKDLQWKISASNWVIYYFSDFICDTPLIPFDYNLEKNIAVKHAFLIWHIFTVNKKHFSEYRDWVFANLGLYWSVNFKDMEKVAHELASMTTAGHNSHSDNIQPFILYLLQCYLPIDLMNLILEDPLCKNKWGEWYEHKTVTIDIPSIERIDTDELEENSLCDANDLLEVFKDKPDDWKDIFEKVSLMSEEHPIKAIIDFMNEFVNLYGNKTITDSSREAIAQMVWYAPPEYRIDIQNLKRKL